MRGRRGAGPQERAQRVAAGASGNRIADPVGKEVRIGGLPYRIIGVVAPQGTLFGLSLDKFAVMPFSAPGRRLICPINILDALIVQTSDPTQMQLAMAEAEAAMRGKPVPGDTPADRVISVLKKTTRGMQGDPHLTEALTRAFMFADASVAAECRTVGRHVTRLLSHALREPGQSAAHTATDEQVAAIRVVSDVWLARLVQWVTGRATADEVTGSLDVAVRLLIR